MNARHRPALRSWLTGLALAAIGVLGARVLAPALADQARLACTLGAQGLALSGLLVIALGVRRRVRGSVSD
jgi:hypothetical protein